MHWRFWMIKNTTMATDTLLAQYWHVENRQKSWNTTVGCNTCHISLKTYLWINWEGANLGFHNILPRNWTMMKRCQDQMGNLTAVMNWYPPAEDIYICTMYPANSPAVLMQWRILITLLSQLSPGRREEFRRIGTGYVLSPRQQSPVKRKAETSVNIPLP